MDSECGGPLQALQGVAWVSSPTYNGHVRGNLDCDWIIKAQDDSVVNIQVTPLLNMNLYLPQGPVSCFFSFRGIFVYIYKNAFKTKKI